MHYMYFVMCWQVQNKTIQCIFFITCARAFLKLCMMFISVVQLWQCTQLAQSRSICNENHEILKGNKWAYNTPEVQHWLDTLYLICKLVKSLLHQACSEYHNFNQKMQFIPLSPTLKSPIKLNLKKPNPTIFSSPTLQCCLTGLEQRDQACVWWCFPKELQLMACHLSLELVKGRTPGSTMQTKERFRMSILKAPVDSVF